MHRVPPCKTFTRTVPPCSLSGHSPQGGGSGPFHVDFVETGPKTVKCGPVRLNFGPDLDWIVLSHGPGWGDPV